LSAIPLAEMAPDVACGSMKTRSLPVPVALDMRYVLARLNVHTRKAGCVADHRTLAEFKGLILERL
jgi:hypothetical protein